MRVSPSRICTGGAVTFSGSLENLGSRAMPGGELVGLQYAINFRCNAEANSFGQVALSDSGAPEDIVATARAVLAVWKSYLFRPAVQTVDSTDNQYGWLPMNYKLQEGQLLYIGAFGDSTMDVDVDLILWIRD